MHARDTTPGQIIYLFIYFIYLFIYLLSTTELDLRTNCQNSEEHKMHRYAKAYKKKKKNNKK